MFVLQNESSITVVDPMLASPNTSVYESANNSPAQLPVSFSHEHVTRSRTSSVSSQASDASFFSPIPTSRAYPLPSDVESASEYEDSGVVPHTTTKEELYHYFRKMQRRSEKYKAKFTQV